jgi:hypothetical protein
MHNVEMTPDRRRAPERAPDRGRPADGPSHPAVAGLVLMVGVVVLIVLLALASHG